MSNDPLRLVRVKDPNTGAEFTASHQYAKDAGFTITDKPVSDEYGRPVPAKGSPIQQPAAKSTAKTKES